MIARCRSCHSTNLALVELNEDYLPGHSLDKVYLEYYCSNCDTRINTRLNVSASMEEHKEIHQIT